MLLTTIGKINAISEKLRAEIETKVLSFGDSVRYQFDISKDNPDPEKKDGKVVWPHVYTLQPRTFVITDPYISKGAQNSVKIGLVDKLDEKGEKVEIWGKIQVLGQNRGIVEIKLDSAEGISTAMFLELHPKMKNGIFSKEGYKVFYRIDEKNLATEQRAERSLRKKAMDIAEKMSDAEAKMFSDAMTWDEHDIDIIRNMIEDMAENEPAYFIEMHDNDSKSILYQGTVQRAKDKKKIIFDNVNNSYTWENGKVITMLAPESTRTDIEQMALWLQTGGEQAQKAFEKIQTLIK
jgi:bacterioferritin (cytochrome b1)